MIFLIMVVACLHSAWKPTLSPSPGIRISVRGETSVDLSGWHHTTIIINNKKIKSIFLILPPSYSSMFDIYYNNNISNNSFRVIGTPPYNHSLTNVPAFAGSIATNGVVELRSIARIVRIGTGITTIYSSPKYNFKNPQFSICVALDAYVATSSSLSDQIDIKNVLTTNMAYNTFKITTDQSDTVMQFEQEVELIINNSSCAIFSPNKHISSREFDWKVEPSFAPR